jgi:hypothetical protein
MQQGLLAMHVVRLGTERFGACRDLASTAVAGLLGLAALPWVLSPAPKVQYGVIEAARQVWAHRVAHNPSVLIATDGGAEGAAVAELAMNDPARPSLFAVRGSRLLGGGGYNEQEYVPLFQTAGEVMAAIDDYAIPLVLVRGTPGRNRWRHVDQVEQAREMQPDRWELIYEDSGGGVRVRLYRIHGNDGMVADFGRLRRLSAPRALASLRQ